MNLELTRLDICPTATFGILKADNKFVCFTLELPWKENQHNISCIPTGKYLCTLVKNRTTYGGMKIAYTYEVSVPGRDGVLFHIGNYVGDTRGCILPGLGISIPEVESGTHALSSSTAAFNHFLKVTNHALILYLEVK